MDGIRNEGDIAKRGGESIPKKERHPSREARPCQAFSFSENSSLRAFVIHDQERRGVLASGRGFGHDNEIVMACASRRPGSTISLQFYGSN